MMQSGVSRVRKQIAVNNPFVFKHISNLTGIDHFDDVGPCVILASPGMMQSGVSRELFESWCSDKKNGCIVAGYCVEGTLAKLILSHPTEITAMNGQKLPLNMKVEYISFSAHTDYPQTSGFIRALKPPHVVLVHGEANEMSNLKRRLIEEYENDPTHNIEVHNPRNTVSVDLYFSEEKTAKVMGSELKEAFLAMKEDDLILERLKELDFNGDSAIEFPEFVWGLSAWVGMDEHHDDDIDSLPPP